MSAPKRPTAEALIQLATVIIAWKLQTAGDDDVPLRVTFWRTLMITSQAVARTAGRLGIHAENRYRQTVSR